MFRRILLWFAGMLGISFVGFMATSYLSMPRSPGREPMMRRLSVFQLNETIRAYETGGKAGAADYVKRLDSAFPAASHFFVDAKGHDLVTGDDRSEILERARQDQSRSQPSFMQFVRWWMGIRLNPPRSPFRRVSADGRYSLIIESEPTTPEPMANIAVYGWIVAVILMLSYALAWTLVQPIRRLRETVVRFGAGSLETR